MAKIPNEGTEPRVQQLFIGSYLETGMGLQSPAGAGLCVKYKFMVFLVIIIIVLLVIIAAMYGMAADEEVREKVKAIRQENLFWNLFKYGYDGINFNIEKLFAEYVYMLEGHPRITDVVWRKSFKNELNKNIITDKNHVIDNVNIVVKAVKKKDEEIIAILKTENIKISKKDFINAFNKKSGFAFDNEKDAETLDSYVTNSFDQDFSLLELWERKKKLNDSFDKYQFDYSGNYKHNRASIIVPLKMGQFDFDIFADEFISKNIPDISHAESLKRLLEEYEQLIMLRWCLVDISVAAYPVGSSRLDHAWWQFVSYVSK